MQSYERFSVSKEELQNLTPLKARDIIVHCFFDAQKETFARVMKNLGNIPNDADLKIKLEGSVRLAFQEAEGDFNHPNLQCLMKTVEVLGNKAAAMGTPSDIIAHHQAEIMKVFEALEGK